MNAEQFERAKLLESRIETLDAELKNFERLRLVVGSRNGDDLYCNTYDASQERSISGQMKKELAVAVLDFGIETLQRERVLVQDAFNRLVEPVKSEKTDQKELGHDDQ
jgi:hypothetical protein